MGHKKVQVVVLTKKSPTEVLILQTNARRGSFWQNVTGSVEKNEDYLTAAKRELEEETRIGNKQLLSFQALDFDFRFTDQFKRKVKEECFLAIIEAPCDIVIDPSEHQAYQWKKVEDLSVHDFKYPSNFEALTKAFLSIKKDT